MKSLCSFFFYVVLLGVANGRLLGGTECTYGPSFWCHSLQNAKQCSAVKHCIQTVWEKLNLPEDNDDICGICKNMVQQARDVLQSNETQEELKQVFDGSCQLIPLKEVSQECMKLAEEFIPELIETLSSQMNPQVVCATAGLCNNHHVDKLLMEHGLLPDVREQVSKSPSLGDDCRDCNNFFRELMDKVRSNSKQQVMDRLLALCGELGSVSDGCSALVTVNIDVIYDYLTNGIDPVHLCAMFDMCGMNLKSPVKNNGDEVCDFCVVIAQHWRDMLVSNSSEEEFKEVLAGICKQTGSFANECQGLVDNYAIPFYNFLMNNFEPKALCEMVGICSQTLGNNPLWTTLHVGSVPADSELTFENTRDSDMMESHHSSPSLQFVGRDEANSYRGEHEPKPSIKVTVTGESGVIAAKEDNQLCTMCEFTLHFIQIQLQEQSTREQIEHAVKNVCNLLPADLKEQCGDYVDAYGDQVIALLQQEIDPSVLCPMLGLCPKKDSHTDVIPSKEVISCVACEFIMKKVKEILVDRTDEEAVRHALDTVCSVLPGSLSGQCTTFVDQNAIEVMQLLAAGVDPEQVCRMLNFCKDHIAAGLSPLSESNQLPMARLFVPPVSSNGLNSRREMSSSAIETTGQSKTCIVCEMVMVTIERLVLDNSTHIQDEVQKAMDIVCLHLPSTLQEDCLGFVDQYSKSLIELLISKATPQTVCREVRLCEAASVQALSVTAEEPVDDERSCLVCKAVATVSMSSNYQLLQIGGGEKEEAINTICDGLTGGERMLCLRLKQHSFTPYTSRTQQCSNLGHCGQPLNLVGAEKCTWGPSYWCQSTLHANSCGAISHCQDRVWLGSAPPS